LHPSNLDANSASVDKNNEPTRLKLATTFLELGISPQIRQSWNLIGYDPGAFTALTNGKILDRELPKIVSTIPSSNEYPIHLDILENCAEYGTLIFTECKISILIKRINSHETFYGYRLKDKSFPNKGQISLNSNRYYLIQGGIK
jgi:hypothetical protein